MKASSATFATATEARLRAGRSSDSRPTPTNAEFALAGPSDPPDPRHNAFRKDIADIALAGRVIASHYAEPLKKAVATATALHSGPSADSEVLASLEPGEIFELLDTGVGWSWGYGGSERLVGYISTSALEGRTA